jgi:HNH endonuclease
VHDNHKCQGCGTTGKLHVHHRTYARFGGEELPRDLITVCEACHTLIHQFHQQSGNLSLDEATSIVLNHMRPRDTTPRRKQQTKQQTKRPTTHPAKQRRSNRTRDPATLSSGEFMALPKPGQERKARKAAQREKRDEAQRQDQQRHRPWGEKSDRALPWENGHRPGRQDIGSKLNGLG